MVQSNPPSRRTAMTGIVTASSTSDWPRLLRRAIAGVVTSGLLMLISVGLRLQPHVVLGGQDEWSVGDQRPRLPLVLILDGDAHEVARPVGHVAQAGGPWLRVEEGGTEEVVLVDAAAAAAPGGIDGQGSGIGILVQAIDVDLGHLDDAVLPETRGHDRADHLHVRVGGVAGFGAHPGALPGGIGRSAYAEHQEAGLDDAEQHDERDRRAEGEFGYTLAATGSPAAEPLGTSRGALILHS